MKKEAQQSSLGKSQVWFVSGLQNIITVGFDFKAVSFPYYLVYLSPLVRAVLTQSGPNRLALKLLLPLFSSFTLVDLAKCVSVLQDVAISKQGQKVTADAITNKTRYPTPLLIELIEVTTNMWNEYELKDVLVAACFLGIEPIINALAFCLALKRSKSKISLTNQFYGNYTFTDDQWTKILKSLNDEKAVNFDHFSSRDLEDQRLVHFKRDLSWTKRDWRHHFQKHLKLLELGKREYTIEDYLLLPPEALNFRDKDVGFNDCKLTSLKGISQLPEEIRGLYLYRNSLLSPDIDSYCPSAPFKKFTYLTKLYLSLNQLSGLTSNFFMGLDNLSWLDLSDNKLTTLPDNVFDYTPYLVWIDLSNNWLRELPKDVFKVLHYLHALNVTNNYFCEFSSEFRDFYSISYGVNLWFYDQKECQSSHLRGLTLSSQTI